MFSPNSKELETIIEKWDSDLDEVDFNSIRIIYFKMQETENDVIKTMKSEITPTEYINLKKLNRSKNNPLIEAKLSLLENPNYLIDIYSKVEKIYNEIHINYKKQKNI